MTSLKNSLSKRIISITETSPGVFRISRDGKVWGDSRGYNRACAIAQAKAFVARNATDGEWQGSTWVEFENVIDPSISE